MKTRIYAAPAVKGLRALGASDIGNRSKLISSIQNRSIISLPIIIYPITCNIWLLGIFYKNIAGNYRLVFVTSYIIRGYRGESVKSNENEKARASPHINL